MTTLNDRMGAHTNHNNQNVELQKIVERDPKPKKMLTFKATNQSKRESKTLTNENRE